MAGTYLTGRRLFTKPTFSFQAFVGLAIPLCFVTMASQNAPGVAVLRNAGYETPANPLVTTTGIISFLLVPFGAHGINLAAITAAICTGREAHNDTSRRYVAGVFCGLFYILIGTFGATLASVFTSLPEEFVTALAGLALLGALGGGLTGSFASEHRREPALITFLATTSGFTFFGIGAPFWGLVAGAVSNFILFGNIRNLRKAN